ncbi:hypothetical protein HMPREF0972_00403 [Actinomyces sp. oral taxon 848 str. F0332]|nr:hypothetical protein HMPREF0972_00403 [Actinomyces sp. oral taxon 848 str. F0332]
MAFADGDCRKLGFPRKVFRPTRRCLSGRPCSRSARGVTGWKPRRSMSLV